MSIPIPTQSFWCNHSCFSKKIVYDSVSEIPLDYLLWELTHKCNLECIHCRADSSPASTTNEIPLSLPLINATLTDACKFGLQTLSITGGEPLLSPHWRDMVQIGKELGLKVRLQTNSLLLKQNDIEWLVKIGCDCVGIGLDGASSNTHDYIRRYDGAFKGAINNIRELISADIPVHVEFTVMKYNESELLETIMLLDNLGATTFMLRAAVYSGRTQPGASGIDMYSNNYREILQRVYDFSKSGRIRMSFNSQDPLWWLIIKEREKIPSLPKIVANLNNIDNSLEEPSLIYLTNGCSAGANTAFINATGEVMPCSFLSLPAFSFGNLMTNSFSNIWQRRGNSIHSLISRKLHSVCGKCEDRFFCGGCRARAYAFYGDALGPDPYCWNR